MFFVFFVFFFTAPKQFYKQRPRNQSNVKRREQHIDWPM